MRFAHGHCTTRMPHAVRCFANKSLQYDTKVSASIARGRPEASLGIRHGVERGVPQTYPNILIAQAFRLSSEPDVIFRQGWAVQKLESLTDSLDRDTPVKCFV